MTYVCHLDEMEDEKGANNKQEDAGELPTSCAPTVLAFRLPAPALAPAESGTAALRSRRCESFVLARDVTQVTLDVDAGTGQERGALAFQVRITREDCG